MPENFLQFESISKRFPGVQALDDISFAVGEGKVHALIGENGAGKSTLLKILSGAYIPDSGIIRLGGKPRTFHSTIDAINAGVAVIYQELHLVPEMTVAENLLLGHMPNRLGWLNTRELRLEAQKQLDALEEDIDLSARVGSLSIAQRQMVEIAKALARDAKVIAFDEPTSSLSDREVKKLFSTIAELKRRGRVIIYVSHRLQEIFEICDSVTVFRDGKVVETFSDMSQINQNILVNRMVGRSIKDIYNYSSRPAKGPALEIQGLEGPGLSEPVNLTVAQGEIVGLFGLVGAGRTELLKLVFGATKPRAGKIKVMGREIAINSPSQAIRNGLAFCPEDRKNEGIIAVRSVMENINISVRRNLARFGVINEKKEHENARRFVAKLNIKTPSLYKIIKDLSGGNQQKVVLARWLSEKVKVMLLDEPTRGIDVGAKSEIYSVISQLASEGLGVLVVSSDLPEVLGIADRIVVMREGKVVASLNRDEATEERVLKLALPVTKPAKTIA